MLGAESQNIFDMCDRPGDNEVDEESDDASADGTSAQQFFLPEGSVQLAGECSNENVTLP